MSKQRGCKLNILLVFGFLAGMLPLHIAEAQTPNFDYPCLISTPRAYAVTANDYAVPCVGDWDDDGDLDLLVGVLYEGYVLYYENRATTGLPEFAEGVPLEADGEVISVLYA